MKKLVILTLLLLFPLVNGRINQAIAGCQEKYLNDMETHWAKDYIPSGTAAVLVGGAAGGIAALVGISSYASGGISLGAGALAVGSIYLTSKIHDKMTRDLILILDQADYLSGRKEVPKAKNDFKKPIPIDGKTDDEIKEQKRANREIKKYNRQIKRFNKDLVDGPIIFEKFYKKVMANVPGLTGQILAKELANANERELMCNGTIGAFFNAMKIEEVEKIEVDGVNRKERYNQRQHNRKVDRYERKYKRMVKRNEMATQKELVEYFQKLLK